MATCPATPPTRNLFVNGRSGTPSPSNLSLQFPGALISSSSWCCSSHPISSHSFSRSFSKWTDLKEGKIPIACSNGKSASSRTRKRKTEQNQLISEGRDVDMDSLICPGCGVFMQDRDANFPGFYQQRTLEKENEGFLSTSEEYLDQEFDQLEEEEEEEQKLNLDTFSGLGSERDEDDAFLDEISGEFDGFSAGEEDGERKEERLENLGEIDWGSDLEYDEENWEKEMDGFAPAGVGYGNTTEETLERMKKVKISKSEKKKKARETTDEEEAVTVCARCHSLRNYGHVKNEKAENLIPDFDFDRFIASRLMKPTGTSNVVVMVVDCVDFDGSFPKRAARSLFKALEEGKKEAKLRRLPKLVLVATKVDLLPQQISPTRLDRWVRNRAKAGGAPKLNGLYLVSVHKDLGVRNLISFVKDLAGPRGNVWVIGAQNAGKSTLINAFAKREGKKITKLTVAAVPGTTLGILRIGGVLPGQAKMYDTPGLLHPYLMTMRLNRDEQKIVEIRKELKPTTYRIKAGQTVHLGCLARLDLLKGSTETIYVTVWASPNISLHLGKLETADEIWKKHAGVRLQPPAGRDRVAELAQWKPQEIKVSGSSWEVNSIDVAIAGLGWFSLCLKGEAILTLWTYDGVETILREPLVLDRAPFLQRPGFLLPKAISDAIGNQTRLEAESKKITQQDGSLLEASI